jgi:predicted small lipoprotein YifL
MVAEAGGGGRRFQALALLCALLAGCGTPGPQSVPPAPVVKAYHSMPEAALPLERPSDAATLLEYQRDVARALHAANPGMVFEGPPPNPLRAVIVMRAEVDAIGGMRRLDLYRAPWHYPWLEALARETVRQAEPLPRPSMKLMNGAQSVTFTETWLFDYQGRFRLRTLSLPQAEPPEEDPQEAF